MRGEQHCVRIVFVGTRDFDKDVSSLEVRPCPGTWRVYNGRIEVIDYFNIRACGLDP